MNSTLTVNALDILDKRYFRKDLDESNWHGLSVRVADAIADAEETPELKKYWSNHFFNSIYNLKFIPSTPCLINAYRERPGQLSSCFILDVRDNIESIYSTKGECAKIFQKNGGAGLNMSALRPKNSAVETSKGYSCGVVGFMEEYDLTADIVTRNNSRKGAIKIDLNDWHPDIYEFISAKNDTNRFKRMNISVSLSDAFMWAVEHNQPWKLKFPDYTWNKDIYDTEWDGDIDTWESKGYPVKVYNEVMARGLYTEIMECAWKTGEPGVSFRDTMDSDNPNPHMGKVVGTNPCAEFSSICYNSCNLGSLNLNMAGKTREEVFAWLATMVPLAVRFLDNMITVNKLPLEKIEKVTKAVRSIGLGVMGFADLLYRLGIRYNSTEGYRFADELFAEIQRLATEASIRLAYEKGVYDAYVGSVYERDGIKIRNSNRLSIAPTGSISFIANTSGGIEPVYALVMTRTTNEGYTYFIVDPVFEAILKDYGLFTDDILQKVAGNNGSCQGVTEIPLDIQHVFVTTYDMTPKEHIEMLSMIQKNVDLSVSKTVNLPNSATVQDVMDVYLDAWHHGIKGITIYRDGCRDFQVLTVGNNTKKEEQKVVVNEEGYVTVEPAMEVAYGKRIKVKTGCGHLWLFFFVDGSDCLAEIWSQVSGGGCKANIESMSRLASLCFRAKIDPQHILDQLSSAFCKTSMDNVGVKSCGAVIAREIKKFLQSNTTIIEVDKTDMMAITEFLQNRPEKTKETVSELLRKAGNLLFEKKEQMAQEELETAASCESCGACKKDECSAGGKHEMNGEGCPSCVKCGYSKCS